MPEWNPIFGHLLVMAHVFKGFKLPPDLTRPDQFSDLSREFEKSDSSCYVHLWAFIKTLLAVASPKYAIQVCQRIPLGVDRPKDLVYFMHAIAGENNQFTSTGPDCKVARTLLADGFNTNYILNQTEHVVWAAEVYVETL